GVQTCALPISWQRSQQCCAAFARVDSISHLRLKEFRIGLFSKAEKCFEGAGAERFPNLNHFIGDDCGEGYSEPNKNRFDRQAGPCSDVQTHHCTRPVFPPTVRQRERRSPKQTDQEQQEKRKTESAPINEWTGSVKKASRRNQGSADEINEIPWKAVGLAGPEFSIHNRSCD